MRFFVLFRSAFRSEASLCISHETTDKVRTFCGRDVAKAETVEPDDRDIEPDCLTCNRVAAKRKEQQR